MFFSCLFRKGEVKEVKEIKENILALNDLPIGCKGCICQLRSNGIERRRMLDLGLVQGTVVEALQKSPSGDPIAYFVRGTVIALRGEDAAKITVQVFA